jgi:hypothetical protein
VTAVPLTPITNPSQLPSWYEGLEDELPARLSDFHGPADGEVDLPVHIAWSGTTQFDLARDRSRYLMYQIVITTANSEDMTRYLHPTHLVNDWGQLCWRLGRGYRRAWESRYPDLAEAARQAGWT